MGGAAAGSKELPSAADRLAHQLERSQSCSEARTAKRLRDEQYDDMGVPQKGKVESEHPACLGIGSEPSPEHCAADAALQDTWRAMPGALHAAVLLLWALALLRHEACLLELTAVNTCWNGLPHSRHYGLACHADADLRKRSRSSTPDTSAATAYNLPTAAGEHGTSE
jgi:hypothetical protein